MGPANVYPARDVPRELPEMGSEMLDVICPVQESDVMHNVGSEIDSPGFALVLLGVGDDLIGLGHCGQAQVLQGALVGDDGIERIGPCLSQACLIIARWSPPSSKGS